MFIKSVRNNDVNNCGDDWVSYSDIKCLKVLESKGTEVEAKGKCSQLDNSSTLITIGSQSEQQFVTKLLSNYSSDSVWVWIGLEYVNNGFKWMDGSDKGYENWDENAIKDGNDKCVQLSLSPLNLGKWTDDNCNKKYLIACQKKQPSKNVLEQQINNLTSQVNSLTSNNINLTSQVSIIVSQVNILKSDNNNLTSRINNFKCEVEILNQKIIPINFIYTQLPNQSSPQQIWPQFQWKDVTQQYSGLFFRAEGEGSQQFGTIQPSNQSWISNVKGVGCTLEILRNCRNAYSEMAPNKWSNNLIPQVYADGLYFYTTGGEVRPKNTAIRIWIRIK